jgi:hypothetical protein
MEFETRGPDRIVTDKLDVKQSFVSPFASKATLQVLHMRQSGPDLRRYSSWAKSAEEDDTDCDYSDIDLPAVERGVFPQLGASFVKFAQWAFGPEGILSLRLLAYGDFSYNGRFGVATLLLCRREVPEALSRRGGRSTRSSERFLRFREVKEREDWELWELYERELGILAACPTDTLFRA